MIKNIFNNKNNFIVYDIYNTIGDLTEYFFVCQNSGNEKTINNFMVLDIFNGHFLTSINEQLSNKKKFRASLEELNNSVWSSTCETLNVNHAFIDIFKNNVMYLNTDLSEITEEDILELNFIAYGPSYIKNKDYTLKENDSFIIYKSTIDGRLNFINREYFSSLVHNKALQLKDKYKSEGISKKMVELNKEAIKIVCMENNISYIENEKKINGCNHEYQFLKRIKSEDLFLGEGVFYYSFKCTHCGETKYILNTDILNYIHETSIDFIKCELSAPKEMRAFNFQVFDFALDKFLSEENIRESFKLTLKEDYELPKLNKELILINEDDLISSNIVFSNTIAEETGLFSKKVKYNVSFTICKSGNEFAFLKHNSLIDDKREAI